MTTISAPQLKRLNTVYGQWASRELHPTDRAGRLANMAARLDRKLTTTKDLTSREAKLLIDSYQAELGVAETIPSRPRTRKDAQKAGTEGRHDQIHAETTIAGREQTTRLQRELSRLGWDQARLQAFLRSPTGPLRGRTTLRTLGDYNKLHWAIKDIRPRPEEGVTA